MRIMWTPVQGRLFSLLCLVMARGVGGFIYFAGWILARDENKETRLVYAFGFKASASPEKSLVALSSAASLRTDGTVLLAGR